MKQTHVVITREWHNPEIRIRVTHESIAIDLPLEDFVKALAVEYGNPATTVTQAQHALRLAAAANTVCEKMKAQSSKVM